MRLISYAILLLFLLACFSPQDHNSLKMIHIAHTRMESNEEVAEVLSRIDFLSFDYRLLGGDLAINTARDLKTMVIYDEFFDFQNPRTLWALGNHDYRDLQLVQDLTGRNPYYLYADGDLVFLVFDNQDSLGHFGGAQLELLREVAGSISSEKHVILLHHKLSWMVGHPELESLLSKTANGPPGDCFSCTGKNNFYEEIYPLLLKIKAKGNEVYCIAGDLGFHRKSFEYITSEGIHFLASGFDKNDRENAVLILEYDPLTKQMKWRFELAELLAKKSS